MRQVVEPWVVEALAKSLREDPILNPIPNILKGTKKTVIEVDHNDLDTAITSFLKEKGYTEKNFDKYGYECIAENEWCNYQSHCFTAAPNMPTPEELEDLGGLSTGELLDFMCAEGKIEAGEYLIEVFW